MWNWLPPELRVKILTRLELRTLRALKCMGRDMANDCRRTIRSEAWQDFDWVNMMFIELALSNNIRHLKLPMTVSVLDSRFRHGSEEHGHCCVKRRGGQYLMATLHSINIMCLDHNCDPVVLSPESKAWDDMKGDNFTFYIIDLCIDVHGYGIISSETELRMLLDRIIYKRGARRCPPVRKIDKFPKRLKNVNYSYDEHGVCHAESFNEFPDELPTSVLLDSIYPIAEVARDKFVHYVCPFGDGCIYSVFLLMGRGYFPFE